MKNFFIIIGLCFVFGILFFVWRYTKTTGQQMISTASVYTDVAQAAPPPEDVRPYAIQPGDTFATIAEQFNIPYEDGEKMREAAGGIYDLTKIRTDREIRFVFVNNSFVRMEYDIDTEEMIAVKKDGEFFTAEKLAIDYDIEETIVSATVESSLFVAASAAGVEDRTILEMAEVLAWSIDFSTAIRPGDSFTLLYEKRTKNGARAPSGNVLAVSFVNDGKEFTAFRFIGVDGKVAYYDAQGASTVRQFLKAPLTFSRITSGYSLRRFHPVLGQDTAHRAIDYVAPIGTPIHATAAGTITFAGYNGGYGNYIDIKRNETYATQYAHLSRYAAGVKKGVHVEQGDVIGYVGSTGWSTGPHLHYQIKKNGALVNPLTIDLPAGDPVPESEKEAFFAARDKYVSRLAS